MYGYSLYLTINFEPSMPGYVNKMLPLLAAVQYICRHMLRVKIGRIKYKARIFCFIHPKLLQFILNKVHVNNTF